jgi:RimJ/RimL family protein N-acetyltransferase
MARLVLCEASMLGRPTIDTARPILRPFTLTDAPAVRKLAGDRDIAAMGQHIPHPYEDGMAGQWIATHQAQCEAGERVNLAIVLLCYLRFDRTSPPVGPFTRQRPR